MLSFITEVPGDRPVSGVHCIPVLDNGNIVMVWDRNEQVLTTIGGRVEQGESLASALQREALEEAGIVLDEKLVPFACWYWEKYGSYRVYYLAKVQRFVERPPHFETTGYVITNVETALAMIRKLEGREERIAVVRRAGLLSGALKEDAR